MVCFLGNGIPLMIGYWKKQITHFLHFIENIEYKYQQLGLVSVKMFLNLKIKQMMKSLLIAH